MQGCLLWACCTVTGSYKIASFKHFLLICAVFQSFYYSSKADCFGFQVGMAPNNRLLANARYMIVKFLCQNPYQQFIDNYVVHVACCLFLINNGMYQVSVLARYRAIFCLKSIGIGSVGENWYRCITSSYV